MRYVAFLRGINVSGHNMIKMDALKRIFEVPEFNNVVTYIQSGNVLFDTNETDTNIIKQKVEQLILAGVGFEVVTIIRSREEIESVIAQNPFGNLEDTTRKLYVHFLSHFPHPEKHSLLYPALCTGEEFRIIGRELYFITPGAGNTKLTNAFMEKKLVLSSTARNWATVNKMVTM